MPFEDIAMDPKISVAQSTLKHVFHDRHESFGQKATHEPSLSANHMETQLAFAHIALHIA